MKIQYKNISPDSYTGDVLIIGITGDGEFLNTLKSMDQASGGFFSAIQKSKQLPQKNNSIRTFYQVPNTQSKAVAIIAYDNSKKGLKQASKHICKYIKEYSFCNAGIHLVDNDFEQLSPLLKAKEISQNLLDTNYTCETYKSKKRVENKINIDIISNSSQSDIETGIEQGSAIASGMNTLKDLGNAPGNICTPRYLATYAKQLAKKHDGLSIEILKEKEIKELKMGALLSVSQGSAEKPRLIKLEHKGGKDKPIILVGKGVTFDTGGISLKPGAGMEEMKYDMCGAGSVIGVMETIAMLNLPINVIGIVPTVENMPSGTATRPGDIVTSMSGKTIEVLNTDAEGRMILCDALTYAQQFKPKALIDIATLTGAIIVALGRHPSGIMSNDQALADALLEAGDKAGDRAWQLPIWEEYVEQLKSPFADLQNIGGKEAGSITAGCFLGEFTKDVSWAHIDIAGTAWQTRKEGATGRPVPLLVEYIMSQIN